MHIEVSSNNIGCNVNSVISKLSNFVIIDNEATTDNINVLMIFKGIK